MKQACSLGREMVEAMANGLAKQVCVAGKLSHVQLDQKQPQAFELAFCLGEIEAADALVAYAKLVDRPFEIHLATVYVAQVLQRLAQTLTFSRSHFAISEHQIKERPAVSSFVEEALHPTALSQLADELLEREIYLGGHFGLHLQHFEVRELFARFSDERVAPLANHIHRFKEVLPESLLNDMAELGVFGLSIPAEYGGNHVDHLTTCLATEELSRGSLGAGGSVVTRPETCAKALLKAGSPKQKQYWLPKIASGERIACIAVTEPHSGSDIASLTTKAEKVEGGYLIQGEKNLCSFAGRAEIITLLARTGHIRDGALGLSLFIVEKPAASRTGKAMEHWAFEQTGGGKIEGHAISTIGYRGMNSYSITFDDYFVPERNRIGNEGDGFALQKEGFTGAHLQCSARAVGVMEAAFRKAIDHTKHRNAFGRSLSEYSLPRTKLVKMAATIQGCRQFMYRVAQLMDEGKGRREAAMAKLISCREAEWLTREVMQLCGGMGYTEGTDVSRYWLDARVLSMFEGADDVLALYVVAQQYLNEVISRQ